jgi:hypothetical protein
MKVLTSFLVILLFPFSAFAASVDLSYIIVFGAHGYTTYDYKTDLDCKAELGFNVDSQFINSELEKALNLRNISLSRNSKYSLRLYVTHKDCGSVGQIDKFNSLFGTSENTFANAELRIVSELIDKTSGQIVSMREFIAASQMKRKTLGFMRFYLQYEIEDVYFSDLFNKLLAEIVKGIEEDL